jgi:hypothetical protein
MDKWLIAPYDNLHFLINTSGEETEKMSFSCFKTTSNLEMLKHACPSLFQWAEYIVEPLASMESKTNMLTYLQAKPMKTYAITDTAIKWKEYDKSQKIH